MSNWALRRLQSWGRLSAVEMPVAAPGTEAASVEVMRHSPQGSVIPFGAGRSYGDQPVNSGGAAIVTSGLDRILELDVVNCCVLAESGVTIGALVRACLQVGLMPPVSPGTGFATLGGCLANDVHGKNHETLGSFGQHVEWFDLLLPSGEVRRVGPDDGPLFSATVGGMGLTGLVLRLRLKLLRVRSNAVELREERVPSLGDFIDRFEQVRATAPYSVGWIDAMATGASLGRGVLETAAHSDADAPPHAPTRVGLPWDLPGFVLGPLGVKAFNALYYRRIPTDGRHRRVHIERFLYPLDAISHWNRLYGRRGFFQFQCVLPDAGAPKGLRRLLEAVSESQASSFLAVLKTMGGAGPGMLSFPLRGYTLALDLPNRPGARELLSRLEGITLDHAGRVYLAKDATLSAAGFRRMYPRTEEFSAFIEAIDPEKKIASDMARRLNLRPTTSNSQSHAHLEAGERHVLAAVG